MRHKHCFIAVFVGAKARFAHVTKLSALGAAEDPMWWSEENLDILKGTRLEAAVEHYVKGLEDLRVWRARLCTIQRCSSLQKRFSTSPVPAGIKQESHVNPPFALVIPC